MKRNYSKLISVTLILVVVMTLFVFPTPVYAGAKPPLGEQTAYAVFENSSIVPGDVGDQIGSDSSPVTVDQDQYIFVCIQQDFTQALKQHGMACQWRTWGGTWQTMAVIGVGSSTDWEYWNSNYTDHAEDAVSDHFGATAQGNYMWESDYPGFGDQYPSGGTGKHETWLVVQAPNDTGRYELRWYDSTDGVGMTPTVRVDITVHLAGAPYVSTQAASSVGDNSAILNGNITDIGDADVSERGFDWGFTDSYGSSWTETGTFGAGTYNHGISGLDTGTLYHFRAKAHNSYGWTYGADMEFTTTGLPSHPYLQIVQGAPEKGSEAWFEWIVVNPSDSSETCTEVRVKRTDSFDMQWTISLKDPASTWADEGGDGICWSGSESIPAHSTKHFRVRAKVNIKIDPNAMTWSATVEDVSVQDVTSDISTLDGGVWGGMFYNKPDDTTEQTEEGTYPNGLYAYLDEDINGQPLNPGTEYTFYVNVHEWAGDIILAGGELSITIPKEFTNVVLDEFADFPDAAPPSGGGGSDWTITGHNASNISNDVDHLSFNATTPTGYDVDTNWEFDTRFTGEGGDKHEAIRYICEANVKITTIISITVTDGVVAYGTLTPGATQDTVTLGNTQTATNNGNVAEKFHIKSSNAVGGTNWTLGAAQGANTYTHEFSTNGGSSWTPMTEAGTYYELAAGVAVDGSQTFDLRIGMPTIIDDYTEKTITVTILATAA